MKVILGLPSYDQRIHVLGMMQVVNALVGATERGYHVEPRIACTSLLAQCFNILWVSALLTHDKEPGADYFLLMHNDIVPNEDNWLQIMLDEMDRTGADIVSAVAPLKSGDGLSSTAVARADAPKGTKRRLTMSEVYRLPETFGTPDVGSNNILLANSGLLLVDMRKPWCKEVCFHVDDTVEWIDGVAHHATQPEDWNFSSEAQALGAKLMVTRKVTVTHHGSAAYPSSGPWGTLQTDNRGTEIEIPALLAAEAA